MRAFLDNNIDNYVKTINNKNVIIKKMIDAENPIEYPKGGGIPGSKTLYVQREDFESKAQAAHVPAKVRFVRGDRICTTQIDALVKEKAEIELKQLAEQLVEEMKAE